MVNIDKMVGMNKEEVITLKLFLNHVYGLNSGEKVAILKKEGAFVIQALYPNN